jgi:hypothetical protein
LGGGGGGGFRFTGSLVCTVACAVTGGGGAAEPFVFQKIRPPMRATNTITPRMYGALPPDVGILSEGGGADSGTKDLAGVYGAVGVYNAPRSAWRAK